MPNLLIVAKSPLEVIKLSALLHQHTNGWEHFYTDTLANIEQALSVKKFDMLVLGGDIALTAKHDVINELAARHPTTSILVSCEEKNELYFGNQNQEMFIRIFIKIINKLESLEFYGPTTSSIVNGTSWENFPLWSDN